MHILGGPGSLPRPLTVSPEPAFSRPFLVMGWLGEGLWRVTEQRRTDPRPCSQGEQGD